MVPVNWFDDALSPLPANLLALVAVAAVPSKNLNGRLPFSVGTEMPVLPERSTLLPDCFAACSFSFSTIVMVSPTLRARRSSNSGW